MEETQVDVDSAENVLPLIMEAAKRGHKVNSFVFRSEIIQLLYNK